MAPERTVVHSVEFAATAAACTPERARREVRTREVRTMVKVRGEAGSGRREEGRATVDPSRGWSSIYTVEVGAGVPLLTAQEDRCL